MNPSIGRIVRYKLHAYDADVINQSRADAVAFTGTFAGTAAILGEPQPGQRGRTGHMLATGNRVAEGDEFPAMIVRVFGPDKTPDPAVNLKVELDGTDSYWATSRMQGDEPGQWSWPERVTPATPAAPRVGDVVHYLSFGTPPREDGSQAYMSECRAAIVTELTEIEVNENNPAGDGIYRPTVGLMVANPTGQFFNRGVVFVDAKSAIAHPETSGGTWHHAGHA